MIVDDAITAVYKLLKQASAFPVYKYARPAELSDSAYFVINSLPIGPGILQKCVINVNAYCNDVEPGSPDISRLNDLTNTAISILDDSQNEDSIIFIYFQNQNIYQGETLQSHYSNMRFEIRLLNN